MFQLSYFIITALTIIESPIDTYIKVTHAPSFEYYFSPENTLIVDIYNEVSGYYEGNAFPDFEGFDDILGTFTLAHEFENVTESSMAAIEYFITLSAQVVGYTLDHVYYNGDFDMHIEITLLNGNILTQDLYYFMDFSQEIQQQTTAQTYFNADDYSTRLYFEFIDTNVIYNEGYQNGADYGYIQGYNEAMSVGDSIGAFLGGIFEGLGRFLAFELVPGISIGLIVLIPIVFGVVSFVLNFWR